MLPVPPPHPGAAMATAGVRCAATDQPASSVGGAHPSSQIPASRITRTAPTADLISVGGRAPKLWRCGGREARSTRRMICRQTMHLSSSCSFPLYAATPSQSAASPCKARIHDSSRRHRYPSRCAPSGPGRPAAPAPHSYPKAEYSKQAWVRAPPQLRCPRQRGSLNQGPRAASCAGLRSESELTVRPK